MEQEQRTGVEVPRLQMAEIQPARPQSSSPEESGIYEFRSRIDIFELSETAETPHTLFIGDVKGDIEEDSSESYELLGPASSKQTWSNLLCQRGQYFVHLAQLFITISTPCLLALWGVYTYRINNEPSHLLWRSTIELGMLCIAVLGHWLSSGILLVGVRHTSLTWVVCICILFALIFVLAMTVLTAEYIDRLWLYVIFGGCFIGVGGYAFHWPLAYCELQANPETSCYLSRALVVEIALAWTLLFSTAYLWPQLTTSSTHIWYRCFVRIMSPIFFEIADIPSRTALSKFDVFGKRELRAFSLKGTSYMIIALCDHTLLFCIFRLDYAALTLLCSGLVSLMCSSMDPLPDKEGTSLTRVRRIMNIRSFKEIVELIAVGPAFLMLALTENISLVLLIETLLLIIAIQFLGRPLLSTMMTKAKKRIVTSLNAYSLIAKHTKYHYFSLMPAAFFTTLLMYCLPK